jgi:hypothetical protein
MTRRARDNFGRRQILIPYFAIFAGGALAYSTYAAWGSAEDMAYGFGLVRRNRLRRNPHAVHEALREADAACGPRGSHVDRIRLDRSRRVSRASHLILDV